MASSVFIDKTFDECTELLSQARHYIAHRESLDRREHDLRTCLELGYYQTMASAQLIDAMAWLLAKKAYDNGELTDDEFLTYSQKKGSSDDARLLA
jgi:hypothetical protein